ncbi:The hydrophobe/amphiphile Efflux-1 (HAE1) Family [Elusimicrobium minutum Pei191]|uniref:The hydrophobe/amphiphile Efflux-1 (HAE1) Family n=1 Tax=Elusimicrobium minutum (strain Pei191) TaxID=445932 RepID=B2KAZ2_ELUMP|nr:efflux RND transporter permease subunit [Elusimicrobium minutum]ACC97688.1 The hydrophobe/amphiphile Efflux-1 (HAE1) Family [Elusimicrobium minutum Pei191]
MSDNNKENVGGEVPQTGATVASFFIKRPVTTAMLSIALLVLGVIGFKSMGIDMYPNVELPYVAIQTVLPGASPEEVETSITKIIEESVNTVSGIDEINSYSLDGLSITVIAFELEKDGDVAAQEVRDKVNQIQANLPEGTEAPVISKFDLSSLPVLTIAISGERDVIELTEMSKKLVKESIESISGVGSVNIVGGRKREIHVEVNPFKLYSLGIPISEVKGALQEQNVEIPGGRVEQPSKEFDLRILGRIPTVADFLNVYIGTRNGRPIKISDVGTVIDSGEYERQSTWLNERRTISLEVQKQSGTNTLAVIEGIKARIEEIKPILPEDFQITFLMDQSGNIRESFYSVIEHLILGGLLAAFVVFVFMGSLKSTIISSIAIPISIIGSFFFMWQFGFTLNNMTLLGLTVAVGIVIDDAIVMLENIYRHKEEYGKGAVKAALDGSKEITGAIIATTASIVVIFLPLAFMSGIVGRFVRSYGITVAVAITLSGIVALTLTPMLCAKLLTGDEKKSKIEVYVTKINGWLVAKYLPMLEWALRNRKTMVLISVLLMVSTIPMLVGLEPFIKIVKPSFSVNTQNIVVNTIFKGVGKDFIPQDDSGKIRATIKAPVGVSYEDSMAIFNTLADDLRQLPYIKNMFVSVGVPADSMIGSSPVNEGSILLELEDRNTRNKITTFKYRDEVREIIGKYDGLRTMVVIVAEGPSSGHAQMQYLISGPDIEMLTKYSTAMADKLRKDPRFIDVDVSFSLAKPEYRVIIDRDKAQDLGVKVLDIASALRTMVSGEEDITKFKDGDELYEVRLRVQGEYRANVATVSALLVPSKNEPVRLDSLAKIEEGFGPTQIDRYNRQRQVTVSANPTGGMDIGTGSKVMEEVFRSLNPSEEYNGRIIGMGKEMGKMMSSFIMAFILAFLFKYMILASQMESYTHPVAVLVSLPLTLPFALISLIVTGQTLNIFSLLGLFMLIGVVSKNSILQIDYINTLRSEGLHRLDAILEGNKVRLRPILMTTIALVMGVVSMVFGTGSGAVLRRSLAIVVIGGQTLSLLVTLLMTPVTYTLLDDLGRWIGNLFYKEPKKD